MKGLERGLGGRAGWTLVDQVISSGTNAALSIAIAKSLGAIEFGAFSVAFVLFAFVIGLSKALITDPLIVRFSSTEGRQLLQAGQSAAGTALSLGLVAGALSAAASTALGGPVGAALLGLAVGLPGLLLQDAWRQFFFAAGRPRAAAANDAVWALSQVVLLGALFWTGRESVLTLTAGWGAAATIAALFGALQASAHPRPRESWSWLRAHRDLSGKMTAGYVMNIGAVNITFALVSVIGGLSAVGGLRAAQVLLGPLQVLFPGLTAFALPVLSRRVTQGGSALRAPSLAVSSVGAGAALGWLVLLLLLPRRAGELVLGDTWASAREVLPAVGSMYVLIGGAIGASLALKALLRVRQLLIATVVQAVLILILGCAGASLGGGLGAAVGLAVAHLVGFVLQWRFVARAVVGPPSTAP